MLNLLRQPSFLPSCILAGVGAIFLVLACTLPPQHLVALIGGSAVVIGVAVARLRREVADIAILERRAATEA